MITIQDAKFDARDISQLYYAALVLKENEEEPMQVSLTWLDKQEEGRVEVVGYGIFVHVLDDDEPYPFMYETREELDTASEQVAQQIKQLRNGQ